MPQFDGKLSLADYAAAEKNKTTCQICLLPQRAEIDENYRNGIPRRFIYDWLTSVLGLDVPLWTLEKHISRHHWKTNADG